MQLKASCSSNRDEDGQFFKEQDETWVAQGIPNRHFVLKRRAVPNGQRVQSTPKINSCVSVVTDYTTDIFRVGRQAPPPNSMRQVGTGAVYNDVVIGGPRTAQGAPMMPRFACHIVVDRRPPYTLRLYSGGSPAMEYSRRSPDRCRHGAGVQL